MSVMSQFRADLCRSTLRSTRDVILRHRREQVDAKDAEVVVGSLLSMFDELKPAWNGLLGVLDAGLEVRPVRQSLDTLLDLFVNWLALAHEVEELATVIGRESQGGVPGFQDLRVAIEKASEVERAGREVLAMLNAPWPVIDSRRLRESQDDYDRGRYREVKDIVAEMDSSGPQ